RVPADHHQILDPPRRADNRSQLNRTLNPRLAREWRIAGLRTIDQVALCPMRDLERMRGRGSRRWCYNKNIDRRADRARDSASSPVVSSDHADVVEIRRRCHLLFVRGCDGGLNRWGLLQLSSVEVRPV